MGNVGSSLFFARCVDLYLKDSGVIGMVMPHSALQTGQHSKWRTGAWQTKAVGRGRNRTAGRVLSVDFDHKMAWDLEGLEPNTFFPVPASVVFARRSGEDGKATPLAGQVERWLGEPGEDSDRRKRVAIVDTSTASISPYGHFSRNGATIYPRPLFFVEEIRNPAIVQAGQTITVNPRRGSQDKAPWKSLDLATVSEQTVEVAHVFDVHLGETIVPYATLDPLRAVLPLKRGEHEVPTSKNGVGGIRLGGLSQRMRDRWRVVSNLWEANRAAATKMNLLERLDYYGELSSQLQWRHEPVRFWEIPRRSLRPCLSSVGQVPVVYANGWSASANRSRLSRCAIPSTISMVATLTVHTRCSRSMTFSLWSDKR